MFNVVKGQHPYPRAQTRIDRRDDWPDGGPPRVYSLNATVLGANVTWTGREIEVDFPGGFNIAVWEGTRWIQDEIITVISEQHVVTLGPFTENGNYQMIIAQAQSDWQWEDLVAFYSSGLAGTAATVRWGIIHARYPVATLTDFPYWLRNIP